VLLANLNKCFLIVFVICINVNDFIKEIFIDLHFSLITNNDMVYLNIVKTK